MKHGFALPTIVIATLVMLMILVATVGGVSSARVALDAQYASAMERDAAESGIARATECLRLNGYTPTWNGKQLTPATDCSGNQAYDSANNPISQYLVNTTNMKTTYVVPQASTDSSGKIIATATGSVLTFRTSGTQAKKLDYSLNSVVRYVDQPQLGSGAGWKGAGHIGFMVSTNGNLYGWGDNSSHQLSDTSSDATITTPIKMAVPTGTSRILKAWGSGQGASIICVLASDNQIYCRGSTAGFIPGVGWYKLALPAGLTAMDLSVNGYGSDNLCALASDQQAYCAGENFYGTLGYGSDLHEMVPLSAPKKFIMPGGVTVSKIFTQDSMACAIGNDGNAYCAGLNDKGQLGRGNTTINAQRMQSTPARVLLPAGTSVADIRMVYHASEYAAYYLTTAGDVYMDGSAAEGTANDGTFSNAAPNIYSTPRKITSGVFTRMISVGEQGNSRNSLCLVAQTRIAPGSGVWCLGDDLFGQVGRGVCTDTASFAGASMNFGASSEQASTSMSDTVGYQMNSVMVITTAGNVWSWGDNTYGKLGTGATPGGCSASTNVPAKVALPAGVTAVALDNHDEYTSFILGSDGNVYAMGSNNNGQLGNGTTADSNVPVVVGLPREALIY